MDQYTPVALPTLLITIVERNQDPSLVLKFYNINETQPINKFNLNIANATVVSGLPDLLWLTCGASGAVLVVEDRETPLSEVKYDQMVFHSTPGHATVRLGSLEAQAFAREGRGELKIPTASSFGDVYTVTEGNSLSFKVHDLIEEVGRERNGGYSKVIVPVNSTITMQYLGHLTFSVVPAVVKNYGGNFQNRLNSRFLQREIDQPLSCEFKLKQ